MGRNRKKNNSSLPPNLYLFNGYYKYKKPDTGKFFRMGKDRFKAITAAKQLNALLMVEKDLLDEVMDSNSLFSIFLDKYENEVLPEEELADRTLDDYKRQIKRIKKALGKKVIDEITVKDIADFLKDIPPVQSNRIRSLLITIFKHVVAQGLREDNPAEKTLTKKAKKKRARLSLEGYFAIYNHEKTPGNPPNK